MHGIILDAIQDSQEGYVRERAIFGPEKNLKELPKVPLYSLDMILNSFKHFSGPKI